MRMYMHRGVEERKRSIGRSVPGYNAGRGNREMKAREKRDGKLRVSRTFQCTWCDRESASVGLSRA